MVGAHRSTTQNPVTAGLKSAAWLMALAGLMTVPLALLGCWSSCTARTPASRGGRGLRDAAPRRDPRGDGQDQAPPVAALVHHQRLDGAGGNALIARDAGGWASATTVEQVYGHADVHDPVFEAALAHVWNEAP
jgi:hypothetical protein